jgi:hypothetical protein
MGCSLAQPYVQPLERSRDRRGAVRVAKRVTDCVKRLPPAAFASVASPNRWRKARSECHRRRLRLERLQARALDLACSAVAVI